MGDQEIDVLQKLHLSAVCDHCHHPTAAACGHSAKRSRSPVPNIPTHRHPSSPSTAAANQDFRGYNKIPLPEHFIAASPPPLRRTLSEPIPVFDQQVAAGTPPRPPSRRNSSRSPSYGENPSSKKLKRMKERMREMSQWCNEVASEDDDADADAADDHQNFDSGNFNDPKEESDEHVENPSQEAVFVEKSGECLVLHFKCPCGDGYQILLSGNNCYYKLTNFRNC